MLILIFVCILLLVLADQGIKYWAVHSLAQVGTKSFLKIGSLKILDLTYLENRGALFGSFSGMRWMLVAVTGILIIACIFGLIKYHGRSKILTISLTLITAGGIGNLIDRLFRGGSVVDYFDVQLFDFAIFNFADCCVTIGVVLFFLYFVFIDGKLSKKQTVNSMETEEPEKESDHA